MRSPARLGAVVMALAAGAVHPAAAESPVFRVGPGPKVMSAEERTLSADPAAGMQHAVILLEETERDDPIEGYAKTSYHLRAKIFSNEARVLADVTIPMEAKRGYLREFWGRSILSDGTVQEVAKDDLKEATVVKVEAAEAHVLKAVIPGVVPGCVLDFGWVFQDRSFEWERDITLQRPWPIRLFRYRWLPAQDLPSQYFIRKRPGVDIRVVTEKTGVVVEGKDLPPAPDEPFMPSSTMALAGVTLYYSGFYFDKASSDPNAYWVEVARREEDDVKSFLRKDDALRAAIASMSLPEGTALLTKLRTAYDWLLTNVSNTFLTTSEEDEAEDQAAKPAKEAVNAGDVLAAGKAYREQVTWLYIGMARALGAEAYLVMAPDRTVRYWDPGLLSSGQLPEHVVMVKSPGDPDEKGIFLDPGDGYPFGVLPWRVTPSKALLVTSAGPKEVVLRGADPRQNVLQSNVAVAFEEAGSPAKVRWSAKGSGQRGFMEHRNLRWKTPEERKSRIEDLCASGTGFDVSSAESPGVEDPLAPYQISCEGEMEMPGVAAGRPEVTVGIGGAWSPEAPLFTEATRTYPVVFDFPWIDLTELSVAPPPGFRTGEAPKEVKIESPFGSYQLQFEASARGYRVRRAFAMVTPTIKTESYESLRRFLEEVRLADRTQLIFTRENGAKP